MQTPYSDILDALLELELENLNHICDIGCAYGRVGILSSVVFKGIKFTGFEIVKQRQIEATRIYHELSVENSSVFLQNVLEKDFALPFADVYFIYDFSDLDDVDKILRKIMGMFGFEDMLIIGRGDRTIGLIESKYKNIWYKSSVHGLTNLTIYKHRSSSISSRN